MKLYTRVVPVKRGLLLLNEIVYREFYQFCMICLYTSTTHFLQIWVKLQFRYQSYEPLLEGISAYAEHVTHYFVVFSERSGKMF